MVRASRNSPPEIRQRSRELRNHPTRAESKLWGLLRKRGLGGWRFRRQQAIGPFIADFYCDALKLVIEVDGSSNIGNASYDENRTRWLNDHGYTVIRFWNDDVLNHMDKVGSEILQVAETLVKNNPVPPAELSTD